MLINHRDRELKPESETRVAILQSCYLPWRGYFDIICLADVFVVYDDVQYRKNHWHNRNRIRTRGGTPWITVPVSLPGGVSTKIEEVRVARRFAQRHWRTIAQAYARAPFFQEYESHFQSLFTQIEGVELLSEINLHFLKAISALLGLKTRFVLSRELGIEGSQSKRLVSICQLLDANRYISGPSAKSYLKMEKFEEAGISVEWMDYGGYSPYRQVWPGFEPSVSIVDLIFNVGPAARNFMKCSSNNSTSFVDGDP
jgi:hypothetical protein